MKKPERQFWTRIFEQSEPKSLQSLDIPTLMNEYYSFSYRDHTICTKQRCQDLATCLTHLIPTTIELDDQFTIRTLPTGIKNLGATCYLNSFLQIWFRNARFKDAIFKYQPSGDVQRDIAGILQYIFTELEYTKKRFIDVVGLVKALQVPFAVQQDALEFSKLLLSLLESSLSTEIKNQLFKQYQGEFQYTTTCQKCLTFKSRFTVFDELRIYLTGGHTVEEGIKSLLQSEQLVGDNQYYCESCKGKQDATRKTELSILPSVLLINETLNIVLNRFKYDATTQSKKKLNTRIEFPLILDMSCCVGGKEKLYKLKAVLLHSGASANSGHYVSRVLENRCWYSCDDEVVEKMESVCFEFGEGEGEKKGRIGSTSAYLLVYEREPGRAHVVGSAPEHLVEHIQKQNIEFEKIVEAQMVAQAEEVKQRQERQVVLDRLFGLWDKNDDSEWCFVSTGELLKSILPATTPQEPIVLCNKELVCEHGKMKPSSLAESKRISTQAISILKELNVTVEPVVNNPCIECFYFLLQDRIKEMEHNKDIEVIKTQMQKKKCDYWVSKSWFQEWRKKKPVFEGGGFVRPEAQPYCQDVYCEHKQLRVENINMIGIPSVVYKIIQVRFPGFTAPRSTSKPCDICSSEVEKTKMIPEEEKARIEVQYAELKRLLTGRPLQPENEETCFVLPHEFLTRWRKHIRTPTVTSKPERIELQPFWCAHDGLVYDLEQEKDMFVILSDDEWRLLCNFYPVDGKPIMVVFENDKWRPKVSVCHDCRHLRRSQYTQGDLTVLKREPKTETSTSTQGDRVSKRRKTVTKQQQSAIVTITPETTIREVMMQLQKKYDTPPLYQKIYFQSIEVDPTKTVTQLGILPGDKVEVELFDCEAEFDTLDDIPQLETGFSGTLLHGNGSKVIDLESWACSICTFLNPLSTQKCDMCDSDM